MFLVFSFTHTDLGTLLHDVREERAQKWFEALDLVPHKPVRFVVALQEVPRLVLGRQAWRRVRPCRHHASCTWSVPHGKATVVKRNAHTHTLTAWIPFFCSNAARQTRGGRGDTYAYTHTHTRWWWHGRVQTRLADVVHRAPSTCLRRLVRAVKTRAEHLQHQRVEAQGSGRTHQRCWSLADLSQRVRCDVSTLAAFEGGHEILDTETAQRLSTILGL